MKKLTKENLIKELMADGYLKTPAIIEAFNAIDRKDFVRGEMINECYGNYPLAIGFGQTISQPLTVAFMLELLEPKTGEKILDVGAGSGWQTTLLAQIVGEQGKIFAVERIPELKKFAEENIAKYENLKNNIQIILGDGSKGLAEEAPYDKIIAAATANEIPQAWKDQLKMGGRIVAPIGQSIIVLNKTGQNQFSQKQYFGFNFVPLITA
ncbi:MAG: protein-L-isoaspartate(D-aspartate) O-methyltransferase [Candidatus Liptonbacteria bacterium]|nr:protein-L-isoaspartate(D-aspartate) O-methyltransferase [Candidatus Liptonbacteria bacterium]